MEYIIKLIVAYVILLLLFRFFKLVFRDPMGFLLVLLGIGFISDDDDCDL